MPPRSATFLGDVAAAILAAAAAGVDAVPDVPHPERRYVEAGPAVSWDCEEIVVHMPNLQTARRSSTGSTSGRTTRTGGGAMTPVIPTAEFITTITVCVPSIDTIGDRPVLPPPDEITSASRAALAVFHAAWWGVFEAARSKLLLPAGSGNASLRVEVGDLTTKGPESGLAGATFSTVVPV